MRFLLELVSCCGSQESRVSENPDRPRSADDETKSLVVIPVSGLSNNNNRRKKRGKWGGGRRRSRDATDWRPSLRVISEDTVVAEKEKEKKIESERERVVAKRKCGGGGGGGGGGSQQRATRARARSYYSHDDYGGSTAANVIPAVIPAPFMF